MPPQNVCDPIAHNGFQSQRDKPVKISQPNPHFVMSATEKISERNQMLAATRSFFLEPCCKKKYFL
jgi:hypothetical protein